MHSFSDLFSVVLRMLPIFLLCVGAKAMNGTSPVTDNYIAGVEAQQIYKAAAILEIKKGILSECMGVLITPDIVLTSGHCVQDAKEIKVKLFGSPESGKPVIREGINWTFHPSSRPFRIDRSGQTYMKDFFFEDVGVVLINPAPTWNQPLPIFDKYIIIDENSHPLRIQSIDELTPPNDHRDKNLFAISRDIADYFNPDMPTLHVLEMTSHAQLGPPKSLNFYSRIETFFDENATICKGDDGAPILGKVEGNLAIVGIFHTGGSDHIYIRDTRCSRTVQYYNASLNLPFINKMIANLRKWKFD